jgi:hypothetical protein
MIINFALRSLSCFAITAACLSTLEVVGADEIDFERVIQPIILEHCAACHGVDEGTRESALRLDLRADALRGGESGVPAFVPGRPEESELMRRIRSHDPAEIMPPPVHHKPLTAEQIENLNLWIAQGAKYADHWAFVAPQKNPLPAAGPQHPIDAFVAAKLASMQLKPAEPELSSVLCRRLYLDLIGLPPSPDDLKEFEQRGYAATVDMLLASDRFGEKWARHWLDVARYSDTNGYEKDLKREQWIWRDWVINAINQDLPYDQFIIEQVAGDLLPARTQDQLIATGFLRNSMINEEGAIVPEQFRMVEMFDRVDCIGKAFLGLTTQCAQCHSHKFDPLTHEEYYGLFAFLNNTYEAQTWIYTTQQQSERDELLRSIQAIEERLRAQRPDWQQELSTWESQLRSQQALWQPIVATEMGSISGLNHPTQEVDLSILMKGHTSNDIFIIAEPDLSGVSGIRLEILNHGDLPFQGPGRSGLGTWGMLELEALVQQPEATAWEKLKLSHATADFSNAEAKLEEGKKTSGPVNLLIDGDDQTWWLADRGIGLRNAPSVAVVQFEAPLDLPAGTKLKVVFRMNEMVGCCRISLTKSTAPAALPVDYAASLAAEVPLAERSTAQTAALFTAWRKSVAEFAAANAEIESLRQQFPTAMTSVLHLADREVFNERKTNLLDRGSWENPLQEVAPHTPGFLHPLIATNEPPRLQFAHWLADRRSPLTARVAVNRIWQAIFGKGLVETSEDFGTRAPVPQYRDMLDWLAVDFMEHQWSQKHLIRTIVMSSTYRQSSRSTPLLIEIDPDNGLLTRGPRFRADAEIVHDIALAVSGLITQRLGGPSIIPPVPQNVLDYNYVYPSYWQPAQGAERYRRAVYAFRKRSMPDPAMSSLDAPNGDVACARRLRSNTPMAALTGLNEPIFVEAAQALAIRILAEGGADDASRIEQAFLLCVSRRPTAAELDIVAGLLQEQRQRIADGWLDPRTISTGDAATLPQLPDKATPQDAAAWTIVARVLLNLDETISKN